MRRSSRRDAAQWRREQRALEREIKNVEQEARRRGYTRLRLQVSLAEFDVLRNQIMDWLRENVSPDRYLLIYTVLRFEIAFAHEEDAVHAFLRWGDWMKKV